MVNDYKVIMIAKFAALATLIISDLGFSLNFGTSFNCQQQQQQQQRPIFMLVSKYTALCWLGLGLGWG